MVNIFFLLNYHTHTSLGNWCTGCWVEVRMALSNRTQLFRYDNSKVCYSGNVLLLQYQLLRSWIVFVYFSRAEQ